MCYFLSSGDSQCASVESMLFAFVEPALSHPVGPQNPVHRAPASISGEPRPLYPEGRCHPLAIVSQPPFLSFPVLAPQHLIDVCGDLRFVGVCEPAFRTDRSLPEGDTFPVSSLSPQKAWHEDRCIRHCVVDACATAGHGKT